MRTLKEIRTDLQCGQMRYGLTHGAQSWTSEVDLKMVPNFLLEEIVVRQDGAGQSLDLGESRPEFLNLTLGITRIIEQESLDLSIWASADGETWAEKPVVAFPQKFYCGVYTLLVDLTRHPEARFLRAQWKVNRWGRGEQKPLFGLYLFAQPASVPAYALPASA
jgi:hypothetical protein